MAKNKNGTAIATNTTERTVTANSCSFWARCLRSLLVMVLSFPRDGFLRHGAICHIAVCDMGTFFNLRDLRFLHFGEHVTVSGMRLFFVSPHSVQVYSSMGRVSRSKYLAVLSVGFFFEKGRGGYFRVKLLFFFFSNLYGGFE